MIRKIRKAVVAAASLTFAVLALFGVVVPEGINEEVVAGVFTALTPFLVWLIPNATE